MEKTVKNGFMLNWDEINKAKYALRIHELAILLHETEEKLSWKDALKRAKNYCDSYDCGRDW